MEISDLNDDDYKDIIGHEFTTQVVGWNNSDDTSEQVYTYNPTIIFLFNPVEKKFEYDEELSKSFNLKHYVWAGRGYREDIFVKYKNGKHTIVNSNE
jgi:hypothetical protein